MWTIYEVFIQFVTILLLFCVLFFWPWGLWVLGSLTRDWTFTPSIGRWNLNHDHQGSNYSPPILKKTFPYSLELKDAPGSSCRFSTLAFDSTIYPSSRGSFSVENETMMWALVVCSFLPECHCFQVPSADRTRKFTWVIPVYTQTSINISMYNFNANSYWFIQL